MTIRLTGSTIFRGFDEFSQTYRVLEASPREFIETWKCLYCNTLVNIDKERCIECGAPAREENSHD